MKMKEINPIDGLINKKTDIGVLYSSPSLTFVRNSFEKKVQASTHL